MLRRDVTSHVCNGLVESKERNEVLLTEALHLDRVPNRTVLSRAEESVPQGKKKIRPRSST